MGPELAAVAQTSSGGASQDLKDERGHGLNLVASGDQLVIWIIDYKDKLS